MEKICFIHISLRGLVVGLTMTLGLLLLGIPLWGAIGAGWLAQWIYIVRVLMRPND